MSIETERQLNRRCIELENEAIQWGEKAKWALEQDDTGWWGDVLAALAKRGERTLEDRAALAITGAELISVERERQIVGEGYSLEHDRAHGAGQLAQAAMTYLTGSAEGWPWPPEALKLSGDISRNLVRAGALIAAAIDVLNAPPAVQAASEG